MLFRSIAYSWSLEQNVLDTKVSGTTTGHTDAEYIPSYKNVGNHQLVKDRVFNGGTVTNLLSKEFNFVANIIWRDNNAKDRPSASLTLQRFVPSDGGNISNSYPLPSGQGNKDVPNTDISELTYEKLPAFDERGREYIYFAAESIGGISGSTDS